MNRSGRLLYRFRTMVIIFNVLNVKLLHGVLWHCVSKEHGIILNQRLPHDQELPENRLA